MAERTNVCRFLCFSGFVVYLLVGAASCNSQSAYNGDPDGPSSSSSPPERITPLPEIGERLYAEGRRAVERGRYTVALRLADSLEQVVGSKASLTPAYHLRAEVYKQLSRFDQAATAYDQLIKLRPDRPGIWFERGHVSFRQKDFRSALEYYLRAHRLLSANVEGEATSRRNAVVLDQIGRTFVKIAKTDSALKYYERALKKDSSYATAYLNLARLFEDRGDLERASSLVDRGLSLSSNRTEFNYLKGKIEYMRGEYSEAESFLKRVVNESPWHKGAHYYLGHSLLRSGRKQAAMTYIRRADTLESLTRKVDRLREELTQGRGDARRWLVLARILDRMGKDGEAMRARRIAAHDD